MHVVRLFGNVGLEVRVVENVENLVAVTALGSRATRDGDQRPRGEIVQIDGTGHVILAARGHRNDEKLAIQQLGHDVVIEDVSSHEAYFDQTFLEPGNLL
jgi:hypothetical protein